MNARLRALAIAALALSLLAVPIADAQPAKVPRVALVGLGAAGPSPLFEALRQGLREQGYVEGRNIVFEDRSAVDHYTRLPEVVAEMVRLRVDVIVAFGTTTAVAARKVTETTPIVMIAGVNPVETGLAASLARPGGNVTGLVLLSQELMGKRVELLKETLPGISRIAVLWNSDSRSQPVSLTMIEAAARSLGLRVQSVEVRRPEELAKAFASMIRERAEAFLALGNLLLAHRARVVELAVKHRLPSIFESRGPVDAGGLMSYGPNLADLFRKAATYVDRILKGARPGDLPVEQPTKVELVINLKTAKTLGLTIPPSVQFRADQLIE